MFPWLGVRSSTARNSRKFYKHIPLQGGSILIPLGRIIGDSRTRDLLLSTSGRLVSITFGRRITTKSLKPESLVGLGKLALFHTKELPLANFWITFFLTPMRWKRKLTQPRG